VFWLVCTGMLIWLMSGVVKAYSNPRDIFCWLLLCSALFLGASLLTYLGHTMGASHES
jgi:nitrate reductase gamma subunit